jgi:hypothetical protein
LLLYSAAMGTTVYGVAIALSSFLLFIVQPMVGKFLLPAHGGVSATWSMSLVFFQSALLCGYAYAAWVVKPRASRWPGRLHGWIAASVALAALFAFLPDGFGSPVPTAGLSSPWLSVPLALLVLIGPYFVLLATTNTLFQRFFAAENPNQSPYFLYALSNLGGILGLVVYPLIVEPCSLWTPRSESGRCSSRRSPGCTSFSGGETVPEATVT